jgi:hypothetical protein
MRQELLDLWEISLELINIMVSSVLEQLIAIIIVTTLLWEILPVSINLNILLRCIWKNEKKSKYKRYIRKIKKSKLKEKFIFYNKYS